MKNKIDKEALEQLKRIASSLPEIETGVKVPMNRVVTGDQIIEQHYISKNLPVDYKKPLVLRMGNRDVTVRPNKKYTIEISDVILVNHLEKLNGIWVKEGMLGVNKYITDTKSLGVQQALEKREIKERLKRESVAEVRSRDNEEEEKSEI